MSKDDFHNTISLLKLFAGRSKILLLLLIFLPVLMGYGMGTANKSIITTQAELQDFVNLSMSNPATLGMLGPILSETMEGLPAWRVRVMIPLFAGIFGIIFLLKYTRKEEESGRMELLQSTAVGRKAPLAAALLAVFGANLIGGLLLIAGFLALRYSFAGSLACALAAILCGCFFAGVAGISAQLTASVRKSSVIAFSVLGGVMVFQAIGNFMYEQGINIFYLSPFSWGLIARPFAGEVWGVLLFAALLVALATATAYALHAKRDVAAGLLPERSGKANGGPNFSNVFALAWRLEKGMFFGWLAAGALLGGLLGAVIPLVNNLFANAALANWAVQVGGSGKSFLLFFLYILAQIISAYAIMSVLRLRSEESETRAELVLSTDADRIKWAASHILVAFFGSALIMAAVGAAAGILAEFSLGSGEFMNIFFRSLANIPAIWVVGSIAVFLFGFFPRIATGAGWGFLGFFFALEFLWELRIIGNNLFALSPFAHVYPVAEITAATIGTLIILTTLLVGTGLVGLRRREIDL